MVAVPYLTAVTLPVASTVAEEVLLELQVADDVRFSCEGTNPLPLNAHVLFHSLSSRVLPVVIVWLGTAIVGLLYSPI